MIYLAIDTDVWLWLIIHGIDAEDNFFDELCNWLEGGHVRCIVPQHILGEWRRHKEPKIAYVKTELMKANQLKKTASIQNTELFNSVYNADNFEALGKLRINKVEEIFNAYADIAEVTDTIKLEAANRTLARQAPSHAKDSLSDTVNILAVFAHVRQQALSPVIFTTKNYKDYSDPTDRVKIHPDLLPYFQEVRMTYAYDTDYLFHKILRPQLPSYSAHLAQKKQLEAEARSLEDQQQKDRLSNSDEDFIGNTLMIDQILEQPRPTQFHFKFILDLITTDANCRKYFFQRVSRPIWLPFMESNGMLDPTEHPGAIDGPNGPYLSHWEPLGYLERLSEQIKNGTSQEITIPLLDLVRKISLAEVDNDITHTALIRIVSNLPNDKVSSDILDLIPTWFSANTNKMFASSAACNYLLPKFIHDNASLEDICKGEQILKYLLGVSKIGLEIDNTAEKTDTSYFANAYPWVIMETLVKKDLLTNIARLCSCDIFYRLADTLKLVLLDYPRGLHLPVLQSGMQLEIKIAFGSKDLNFSLALPGNSEIFAAEILQDFARLKKKELKEEILLILKNLGIKYEPIRENEDSLKGLVFALTVDRLSRAGAEPIAEMDLNHAHSKHFRVGYGIILSKYLSAITLVNADLAEEISLHLFHDHQYRLPFFRRVVLHNLSLHFESQRRVFTEIFTPLDPDRIFDDYTYRPDLFILLKNNQYHFNEDEVKLISDIIQAGPPKDKNPDEQEKAYWQFRWYLALNQISPFKEKYTAISEAQQLKDRDVDPTQTLHFRSATIPPMPADQLLELDDAAIIAYLLAFNPKDRWEEPNISGLAETLQQSVTRQPGRMLNMLPLFLPVPYIYIYHLLYGLLEVGRKQPQDFGWYSLINFCRDYLTQPDFDSDTRILKSDSWKADRHWVLGVMAYQVSEVCKQDKYLQQRQVLPVCRETLLLMYRYFNVAEVEEPQHKDYLSHSLNSDNGKFLRACLDYCLCDVRVNGIKPPVFDLTFKSIFDQALVDGCMDAYILLGCYWQYFNYLDKSWLFSKFKQLKNIPAVHWKAFMGGFLFSPAPSPKRYLSLMNQHYQKAIDAQLELKVSGTNGLANHLTALYFWGMLDLAEGGVMANYIKQMPANAIGSLLHTVFFNEKYFEALKPAERIKLENRVIELIDYIHHCYQHSADPEIHEMRRSTVNLVYLIDRLNEHNSRVISEGIFLGTKQYHHHDLFDRLNVLAKAGPPQSSAKNLSAILEAMTFQDHAHLMDDDKAHLSEMIQFLYENGQNTAADTICNRLSKAGQAFAKELYLTHNI
jgi:hypothetical protein